MAYSVNGRRKTASTKQTDRANAERILKQRLLEIEIAGPTNAIPEPPATFAMISREWLKEKLGSGIGSSTKNELRIIIEDHLIPAFGSWPAREIQPKLINEFVSAKLIGRDYEGDVLPVKGGAKTRPQSVSYTRKQIQVMRSVFEFARENSMVPLSHNNPAAKVDVKAISGRSPNGRVSRESIFEQEQLRALFAAAKDPWEELLYRLMAQLGLRIGEALALRAEDYDPKSSTLTIRRTQRRNPRVLGDESTLNYVRPALPHLYASDEGTKTSAGQRQLKVSGRLESMIRSQIVDEERLNRLTGESWLIPSEAGTMISPGNLRRRRWNKVLREAKLNPAASFHSLRHSFASHQIARGTPLTQLSYWLGHANPQITLAVYSHILKQHPEEVASLDLD